MNVHYFQHVPFEALGSIESWLLTSGHQITRTRFFETDVLPSPSEVDMLIVMGGPMSVHDEAEHPWLRKEKAFLRECLQHQKPVLGICLGAQLIAAVLGARVYANPVKEIGWFTVQGLAPAGNRLCLFPSVFEAFHWHGETFDIPPGAVRLATNKACQNQAFQWGASVIGLQFHLEATVQSVRDLVSHCRAELVPSEYVQSEKDILAVPEEKYRLANEQMASILAFLTSRGT